MAQSVAYLGRRVINLEEREVSLVRHVIRGDVDLVPVVTLPCLVVYHGVTYALLRKRSALVGHSLTQTAQGNIVM